MKIATIVANTVAAAMRLVVRTADTTIETARRVREAAWELSRRTTRWAIRVAVVEAATRGCIARLREDERLRDAEL